jgi:hypothetical protein
VSNLRPTLKKAKKQKIDDYHWHEVVDRTWLCMEMLACALENHPVIKSEPELDALLGAAHSAMFRLYQTAGQKHLAKKK